MSSAAVPSDSGHEREQERNPVDSQQTQPRNRRHGFDQRLALLVAVTSFMEFLDGTIIQTAAPTMARDLGVTPADINVAMTVYLLALTMCIPASGWLADRVGTRTVYLLSIAVFTIASILCAISPTLLVLCLMRALQGIGGAMMVPVGRLAVLRDTPPRSLLNAMAYLTWPALLAPVLAPAIGGILTDTVGWRWIFLVNVPLGVAALLAALWLVPRSRHEQPPALDWTGLAWLAVSLAALVGLSEFVSETPTQWLAAGICLILTLAAGFFAVRRMLRGKHPVLNLRVFRIDSFRVGNAGGGVYRLMITGIPFLLTLLFQAGYGWSAVTAGLVVIALFVGNLGIKPVTSPLIRRLGFRTVIVWSNVLGLLIMLVFSITDASTPLVLLIVALLASGAVRSIGFSAYNTIQFVDVPKDLTNNANTMSSTTQQLAATLGIAVAAMLARAGTAIAASMGVAVGLGYRWAFVGAAVLMLIPLVEALRMPHSAGAVAATR